MKILMGGIIVVMVYVNNETDMTKVNNYLKSVAESNDQRCIFLIDANPQVGHLTHLCRDVLNMEQVHFTDSF